MNSGPSAGKRIINIQEYQHFFCLRCAQAGKWNEQDLFLFSFKTWHMENDLGAKPTPKRIAHMHFKQEEM